MSAFRSTLSKDKEDKMLELSYPSLEKIRIFDDFLGEKIKLNREVTVPYIIEKCYEVGIIENFARAAGIHEGDYIGLPNSDEFLYKTIEAASYLLEYEYDEKLDKQLDTIIHLVTAAQEPDGYLRTPYTIYWSRGGITERPSKWSRLDGDLELYSLGHMIEAAVAHYKATSKRTLLDSAIKSADLVDSLFGIDKPMRGVDMIPEIELALIRLYEVTGEERYVRLADYFVEERGDSSGHKLIGEFALDHMPLRKQKEAVGHATFAAYLYSAAADLLRHDYSKSFGPVLSRLWSDAVFTKMSINGGFGSRHDNEGFGAAYDLPNRTAYNEICAAVGFINLNKRMFMLEQNSKYFDVMERTIYNNLLCGVSVNGKEFFYVCPTESDGKYKFNLGWCPEEYDVQYKERLATRKEWIPCACCPPTLARLLPQLPSYAYAVFERDIYVNMYISTRAELQVNDQLLVITQSTEYPWKDKITLKINTEKPINFRLKLRIPGWLCDEPIHGDLYSYIDTKAAEPEIKCNGLTTEINIEEGYAIVGREWTDGDMIELRLPMYVRRVVSHPEVKDNVGKIALQRGPILYCAEGIDNEGTVLDICIPDTADLYLKYEEEIFGGTQIITGIVNKCIDGMDKKSHNLIAIPYYLWSNRGENEMAVWFRRE